MPSANLARLVLIEARRGGLPWLAAGVILFTLCLAAFLSQVALTESRTLQLAIVASLLRAGAVFLIAVHVATSVLREINDRGLELTLSLPLPRPAVYLGRLGGYVLCAVLLALAFSALLLLWAPPAAVALWGVSLALETALMAAVTFFFAVSLAQLVPAIAAAAGLYLLARSMASIQAIADSPLAMPTVGHDIARWGVDLVALLLPRLEAVTRTDWLLYGPPDARSYALGIGGLVVYTALATAAGLFDFQRSTL